MSRRSRSKPSVEVDIAGLAARLLVEGSVRGFGAAKRKAADAYGVHGAALKLPSNLEVLRSIVEYQRIFEFAVRPARNEQLRRAALDAMHRLRGFSPRLHGAVLLGTTLRTSAVELHLFCDELEQVSRFLLDGRVAFELDEVLLWVRRERREPFPRFHTSTHDTDFELTVLPVRALRQRLLSPLDSRPYRYFTYAELAALLASDPGGMIPVETLQTQPLHR